ncbi:MAG: hypothetical protein IKX54_02340 [Lachnospiraceae bacterium]|nr:hypothetical protein [Lachnospiraceae bacterium]
MRQFLRTHCRDIALCFLIVAISILLHSMSYPILTKSASVRDKYRTEDGLPYLSEMDSYLYCRLTEDLAEGNASAALRHSRGDDPYISANATGEEGDVVMGLPILGAAVYKLLSWIPGVMPYGVIYWLAPFIASLTVIPAYLFVRRRTNPLGGLVAGLLVSVAAPFSGHTHAGFYDTDLGLSLLPCIFLLCYAEALLAKDIRRQAAWCIGSALGLCALSTFWRAYYAYFCIGAAAAFAACAVLGVYALVAHLRGRKNAPGLSRIPGAVRGAAIGLAAQVALCLLVRGREFFTDVAGIIGNVGGSLANGDSAFPDASLFVGELQPTPLLSTEYGEGLRSRILNGWAAYARGIVNYLGGWTVILIAGSAVVIFIALSLRAVFAKGRPACAEGADSSVNNTAADRTESESAPGVTAAEPDDTHFPENVFELLVTTAFLFVWLFCGIVILGKGSRFLTIPVLPIGVFCGLGTGLLPVWLKRKTRRGLAPYLAIIALSVVTCAFAVRAEFDNIAAICIGIAIAAAGVLLFFARRIALVNLLAFSLVLSPCMAAFGNAYCAAPSACDMLYDMCTHIDRETPDNSVIASWWDFGYYYEYAAKRLVLGDGGNFNSEWNYWLGQALMSSDERLATGVFRMLAAGGLDAMHMLRDAYTDGTAGVPANPDYVLADALDHPNGYAVTILKKTLVLPRDEARAIMIDCYGLPAETADRVLALTHPAESRPILLVITDDMLAKTGAIAWYGYWEFDGNPHIPCVWRGNSLASLAPGENDVIALADTDYSVQLTRSSDGSSIKAVVMDGNRRTISTETRLVSDGRPVEGLSLPVFESNFGTAFTVYVEECGGHDGAVDYRCLVVESPAADAVMFRAYFAEGNALVYRSAFFDSDSYRGNGGETGSETKRHSASVWSLTR